MNIQFVYFQTTEASSVTLITYPAIILITFTIIKLINIRLHHMFDGEEANEFDSSKDKDVEEGNTGSVIASNQDDENKKTDYIELDVLKKSDENSGQEDENKETEMEDMTLKGSEEEDVASALPRKVTLLQKSKDEDTEEGEPEKADKEFNKKVGNLLSICLLIF